MTTAARIGLNEKARVDQHGEASSSFLPPTICPTIIAASALPEHHNAHPHSLLDHLIEKAPPEGKDPELIQLKPFSYRPPTKRMPQCPRPMAQSPNRAQIHAITISMSFSGDLGADVAR